MELLRNKRILVVVAHPDDELLGPGATIHKLCSRVGSGESTSIKVVILGEGITSRDDMRDPGKWEDELKLHRKNIEDARRILGYQDLSVHALPDNRFDSVPLLDIIKIVEHEKLSFEPDIILTHHNGDVNIDHQLTFQAVMTATRPMQHERVKTLITFETPSGTEWIPSNDARVFRPNLFLEVSADNIRAKSQAMECYEFEKRTYPHPRSPEALEVRAKYWGMTVGLPYAEAFQVVRSIG